MRIAVATLALLAVSVSAKTSSLDGKKTNNKKHRLQANKGLRAENLDSDVAADLAEDGEYWERFLQNDVSLQPTPSPTPLGPCGVKVEQECVLADGTACDAVPPKGPEECGPEIAQFCYVITNVGEECGTLTKAEVTRTASPPGAPEGTTTIDLLGFGTAQVDLCPGQSTEVCVQDTIDTCEDFCYEDSVEAEITMPNSKTCEAESTYNFCLEPGCEVDVSTTCQVEMPDGSTKDCNDIETPPEDCADGENLVPVEYCYTVENVGSSCGDISKLERTRTTTPGSSSTVDLLKEIPKKQRNLCPGETIEVCETDVLDTCQEACYDTEVVVDATMEGSKFVCSGDDEYNVCISPGCLVEVESSCTVKDGSNAPCTEIEATLEECQSGSNMVEVEYCYTITNPGTTCGEISTLKRTRIPPGDPAGTVDLTDQIAPADRENFCPGEFIVVCESEMINTCDDQCYETITEVAIDMEDGKTCKDTDLYDFCVNPGCRSEVSQTCFIEGTETDCSDIPGADFESCADGSNVIPTERCYKIENTGPTCGVVTTFERTVNGITLDLLEGKPEVRLCTGEELEVCETIDINTCVETPDCYESEVTAALKMADGSVCEDEDTYSFCVPPASSESCNVEVAVGCSTEANKTEDGSGNCDVIIPIATRCDSRAAAMTWRFNGGNCEQSFNIQEADKFVCTDFVEGGGPTEGEAYITVASVKDPTDIYFDGPVGVGELFTMFASGTAKGKFDADSTFSIFSDGTKSTLLQQSSVHTSCSQNLFLKDKFGGVQLLIFENEFGLFTCFVSATYSYTLTNEGSSDSGELIEFTSTTNGVDDNCLDVVPEPKTVAPGDTLVVDKNVLLDMTVRQTYDTEVYVKAQTPGGAVCDDTASISFESGNPAIPTFERK